jgi:biotin carboxylase
VLVGSVEQAAQAARSIGYPVILKPRALGASFGVVGVDGPDELAQGYDIARAAEEDGVPYFDEGVLVEEYLTGPEISVDCAVVDRLVRPLFLARKVTGYFPYFEEIGHTIDAADPLLTDPALLDVLAGAHRAVGYTDGITHVELRLTPTGPRVVEINSRLGGDFIPYVAYFAGGVDAGAAAVSVALGEVPDDPPGPAGVAAVHFLYPPSDVVVRHVTVDPAELPVAAVAHGVLARPGQELRLPPAGHVTTRYGYVITTGSSEEDCLATARAAECAFTLAADPIAD